MGFIESVKILPHISSFQPTLMIANRVWLAQWALRLGVWVFLGPWMKVVDIFYMKKDQTTEEARKAQEARMKARLNALLASARNTQIRKEELVKLKDMKKYMFGQYLAVLPKFKQQRYFDFPLSPSCAYAHSAGETYDIACRKSGQHLTGDMIPRRYVLLLLCKLKT